MANGKNKTLAETKSEKRVNPEENGEEEDQLNDNEVTQTQQETQEEQAEQQATAPDDTTDLKGKIFRSFKRNPTVKLPADEDQFRNKLNTSTDFRKKVFKAMRDNPTIKTPENFTYKNFHKNVFGAEQTPDEFKSESTGRPTDYGETDFNAPNVQYKNEPQDDTLVGDLTQDIEGAEEALKKAEIKADQAIDQLTMGQIVDMSGQVAELEKRREQLQKKAREQSGEVDIDLPGGMAAARTGAADRNPSLAPDTEISRKAEKVHGRKETMQEVRNALLNWKADQFANKYPWYEDAYNSLKKGGLTMKQAGNAVGMAQRARLLQNFRNIDQSGQMPDIKMNLAGLRLDLPRSRNSLPGGMAASRTGGPQKVKGVMEHYRDAGPDERREIKTRVLESMSQDMEDHLNIQERIRKIDTDPAVQAFTQAETVQDSWELFKREPLGIIGQLGMQSLPYSAGSMGLAIAGGALGGPAGAAVGAGIGSGSAEYAASLAEGINREMRKRKDEKGQRSDKVLFNQVVKKIGKTPTVENADGVPVPIESWSDLVHNPDLVKQYSDEIQSVIMDKGPGRKELKKVLDDEKAMRNARTYAGRRGLAISLFDAGGVFLGTKAFTGALGKMRWGAGKQGVRAAQKVGITPSIGRKAAEGAVTAGGFGTGVVIDMMAGAGGEAAAQLLTEGEIDKPGEIMAEGWAELFGKGPVEIMAGGLNHVSAEKREQIRNSILETVENERNRRPQRINLVEEKVFAQQKEQARREAANRRVDRERLGQLFDQGPEGFEQALNKLREGRPMSPGEIETAQQFIDETMEQVSDPSEDLRGVGREKGFQMLQSLEERLAEQRSFQEAQQVARESGQTSASQQETQREQVQDRQSRRPSPTGEPRFGRPSLIPVDDQAAGRVPQAPEVAPEQQEDTKQATRSQKKKSEQITDFVNAVNRENRQARRKQIEFAPLTDLVGEPVIYEGKQGTVRQNDDKSISIEFEDGSDETISQTVGQFGKPNMPAYQAGVHPVPQPKRRARLHSDGQTVSVETVDIYGAVDEERQYSFDRVNTNEAGQPVSVTMRNENGQERTFRDPELVDEITWGKFFQENGRAQRGVQTDQAQVEDEVTREHADRDANPLSDDIINNAPSPIQDIFNKIDQDELLNDEELDMIDGFIEQQAQHIADNEEATQQQKDQAIKVLEGIDHAIRLQQETKQQQRTTPADEVEHADQDEVEVSRPAAGGQEARTQQGEQGGQQQQAAEEEDQQPVNERDYRTFLDEEIASVQRGDPESAMRDVQRASGGGILQWTVEHVGDLTHRMTESTMFHEAGYEFVKPKVERALRTLTREYGFEREVNENIRANAEVDDRSVNQIRQDVTEALRQYAEAHRQIPVFNEVQRQARNAAINLGEQNFDAAADNLRYLKDQLDQGRSHWVQVAHEYNPQIAGQQDVDFRGEVNIRERAERLAEQEAERQAEEETDEGLDPDQMVNEMRFQELLEQVTEEGEAEGTSPAEIGEEQSAEIEEGDRVRWTDPDSPTFSRPFKVDRVFNTHARITNRGFESNVPLEELEIVEKQPRQPGEIPESLPGVKGQDVLDGRYHVDMTEEGLRVRITDDQGRPADSKGKNSNNYNPAIAEYIWERHKDTPFTSIETHKRGVAADEEVMEKSENPIEIVHLLDKYQQQFSQEAPQGSTEFIEDWFNRGNRIKTADFDRHAGPEFREGRGNEINARFVSEDGTPLDLAPGRIVEAEEAEASDLGLDQQLIIDYMLGHARPSNTGEEVMDNVREIFQEITGLKLTNNLAQDIIDRAYEGMQEESVAEAQDETRFDDMSEEQIRGQLEDVLDTISEDYVNEDDKIMWNKLWDEGLKNDQDKGFFTSFPGNANENTYQLFKNYVEWKAKRSAEIVEREEASTSDNVEGSSNTKTRSRGNTRHKQHATQWHGLSNPYRQGGSERDDRPAWMNEPPQTQGGKNLVKFINRDKAGKQVGERSIIQFLSDVLNIDLRIGKENTTAKHPGHMEVGDALGMNIETLILRSRTGQSVSNYHEVGHAISTILEERSPGKRENIDFSEVFALSDSHHSNTSPEEGFAEWVKHYIYNPTRAAKFDVTPQIESILQAERPDILKALRDAAKADEAHMSRSRTAIFRSGISDKGPKPKGLRRTISDGFYWAMFKAVGKDWAIHKKQNQDIWHVFQRVYLDRKEGTERVKQFFDDIYDSPADMRLAHQAIQRVPQEAENAVSGKNYRLFSWGDGPLFAPKAWQRLADAGFQVTEEMKDPSLSHGTSITLVDFSLTDLHDRVESYASWDDFELYGQAKVSLERLDKKGNAYTGWESTSREDLIHIINRFENEYPQFQKELADFRKLMDANLLVGVAGGLITVDEAVAMRTAYDHYVPLPRHKERYSRIGGNPTERVTPGLHKLRGGSSEPYIPLMQAAHMRIYDMLKAYYKNREMLAPIYMQQHLNAQEDIPVEAKLQFNNALTKIDVAPESEEQSPAEMAGSIAGRLNQKKLEEKRQAQGDPNAQLKPGERVTAGDIQVSWSRQPLGANTDPSAINIIAPKVGGQHVYYQIEDPVFFNMLATQTKPGAAAKFMNKVITPATEGWKRQLTQNLVFFLRNFIYRDPVSAIQLGLSPEIANRASLKEEAQQLVPGMFSGPGLIKIIDEEWFNKHKDSLPVLQGELLSNAYHSTLSPVHKARLSNFQQNVAEGILQSGWFEGTEWQQPGFKNKVKGFSRSLLKLENLASIPGMMVETMLKPTELGLIYTGQRYLSQKGEEAARVGAYMFAKRLGMSDEAATMAYDHVVGNFGEKPGQPWIHAIYRQAGFLNPGVQVFSQQLQRFVHPDPSISRRAMITKTAAVAVNTALVWGLSNALTPKPKLEEMEERPKEERLKYYHLFGQLSAPFAYGIPGAIQSFTWNALDNWAHDKDIPTDEVAFEALKRIKALPVSGFAYLNPQIRSYFEAQSNWKSYFDQNIVPPWMEMQGIAPEAKAYLNTAGIYKRMGELTNTSPLKVKHVVGNGLSRQLDNIIEMQDYYLSDAPRKPISEQEPAEWPFIGRLFQRTPKGWFSRSAQEIARMSAKYRTAKQKMNRLLDTPNTNVSPERLKQLQEKMNKFAVQQETKQTLDKMYDRVETLRQLEQWDKAAALEEQMTKLAAQILQETGFYESSPQQKENKEGNQ